MQLYKFTVGPFAENTYLLTEGDEALVIDPGFHQPDEMEVFNSQLQESSADLKAVVLTHAHVDHILGLDDIILQYDVPVYLNHSDLYLWNNYASQARMFGFDVEGFDFTPQPLPAVDDWNCGKFTFDVRYTPGHAPDHVSLYSADDALVIAGDTLFREGVGRTDLYEGSMNLLKQSIREHLYTLPDDTTVYPGHGPSTTIGHEKEANPFVEA